MTVPAGRGETLGMGGTARSEGAEAGAAQGTSDDDRARLLPRILRGSSEEILARLVADDPLRLVEFGAHRARARFFLFDPERISERLMARVAHAGPLARPEELDRGWLEGQADQVIEDLIEEERGEEADSPLECDPEDERYGILRSIFVDGRRARACSLAFNTLPESCRRAFHLLGLEKLSPKQCVELGPWDEDALHRDICRAVGALGFAEEQGRPEPDWDGTL